VETPALGQGTHQIRKAKHLVEISLEPVPAQTWRSSFSLINRFRLTLQMVAAASKRRRISIFWRTFSANAAGMLRAFGFPSISTEIWNCEWRRFPSAQWQLGRPQARLRSTKEPGNLEKTFVLCSQFNPPR
jgi:hypothetical protein